MTGAGSRRKGAAYERELARRWRDDLWPDARRGLGQARSGAAWRSGGEVPDVDGTPFWVEAKRRKRHDVRGAMRQAVAAAAEAGDERAPLVVARWDGDPADDALVCMRLADFEGLIRAQREGFEA